MIIEDRISQGASGTVLKTQYSVLVRIKIQVDSDEDNDDETKINYWCIHNELVVGCWFSGRWSLVSGYSLVAGPWFISSQRFIQVEM